MSVVVTSELQGTIVGLFVEAGSAVRAGQVVALVESMKMHHEITVAVDGVVESVMIVHGDTVSSGQPLLAVVEGQRTEDEPAASGPAATGRSAWSATT